MNYLAHAYLSFDDPQLLVGNMMGDYVKGKIGLENLPAQIKNGVILHRKIDEFTDTHPATQRAKTYFRADYRLYAGPFVDNLYDHFLANDPQCFLSDKDLYDFSLHTYEVIENHREWLPERFSMLFDYMRTGNWLYDYRTLKGIKKSFERMAHRSTHLHNADKAFEILVTHFYTLNQCYFELIDDLKIFVKTTIEELKAQS